MADQLTLTPSGSSDTAMEGHSTPAKMTALGYGPPQNLAALERMDMNLSFPAGRHQPGSYRPERITNRVALWYQRNDGPWTPPGLTPPQGDIRNPSMLNNLRGSPLMFSSQYRESIVPSECDTVPPGVIPSDSGYGGSYGAKHSVANGSVCDESLDRNPETQSLIGHIGELNFRSYNQDMMSKGGVNTETPWPPPQQTQPSSSSATDRRVNLEASRICEVCNKLLKTKSELKKHQQRHNKPFKCTVENCPRREGFSTPNDLDRHKRSLHPDQDAAGHRYRCPVGACKHKDKIWPRADNFRAHLKRVHQKESMSDEDLDQYKVKSTPPSKEDPSPACDDAIPDLNRYNMFPGGHTSFASDSLRLPRNPTIDLSTETSPIEGRNQIEGEDIRPQNKFRSEAHLHVLNSATAEDVPSENDDVSFDRQTGISRPLSTQPDPSHDDTESINPGRLEENSPRLQSVSSVSGLASKIRSSDHCKTDMLDASQGCPNGPSLECPEPIKQLEELADISEKVHAHPGPKGIEVANLDLTNRDNVARLLERLQSSGVLEELGYKKEGPLEVEAAIQEPPSNAASGQAHCCPQCPKSFGRRCELKKHEKRHLKPYGCTFPGCEKKFGSKNDWKRHENSQHYMLEHWRCDGQQPDNSSKACGRFIDRRELFKQHLNMVHHISDQETLDIKLETCRVGRNCEARFWCGFCLEIIETKKEGIDAWTERFNHIDDHFHGRNNLPKREISNWENEFPLYPRADESSSNNSEDSRVPSPPVSSAAKSDTRGHTGLEKQHMETAKQKRKRDDGRDVLVPKRFEMIMETPRFYCCECRELMPITSRQCTNVSCQHRLCEHCS